MEVRVITAAGARVVSPDDLPTVLADPSALVWIDVPDCDDRARRVLHEVLGFHLVAVREAAQRQHMPKVHGYADHVFLVLHGPMRGDRGHVHYVELDQFIGERFLVTVHGPVNPKVPSWVPLRETEAVWERVREGRYLPVTPFDLSHAIVSALSREMEYTLEEVTGELWALEQAVTGGGLGDPEEQLEVMFQKRHAVMAIANMTEGGHIVYGRMARVAEGLTPRDREMISDTADQFKRVHALAEGQREYVEGVIDFYRTRMETKMTIAAERLAVIAAITLPATALASILGMNVIVSEHTNNHLLLPILAAMLVMTLYLVRWAHKHEWW